MTGSRRFPSIPPSVLVYLAWKNLVYKKLRSALTIAGIVVGIGSISFLLSLGLGLERLVTGEVIGNQSVRSIDITSPNSKIIKLDDELVAKVESLGKVDRLGRSFSLAGSLSVDSGEVDAVVYGIDEYYQDISNLAAVRGGLLTDDNVDGAYINSAAVQAIGLSDDSVVGKEIQLKIPLPELSNENTEDNLEAKKTEVIDRAYTIVGVIDSGSGSEVFINRQSINWANISHYSQIKLVAQDGADIAGLRRQIESMGLETASPVDTIEQINQIFRYFNIFLVSFGSIGMIVAILGMFNTITVSLLERTKEIGLMSAIGARHRDMRRLFLIESSLLSLLGSAIGIALAFVAGRILNVVMNYLAHSRGVGQGFSLFYSPLWLALTLTTTMIIIGLLIAILPARRAERINPINALRRE